MQERQGDFGAKYRNGKIVTKKLNGLATWKQSCECSKKALRWTYTRTGFGHLFGCLSFLYAFMSCMGVNFLNQHPCMPSKSGVFQFIIFLTTKRLAIWSRKDGFYSLKMYKIPDQVIQFTGNMETWRVELTAGEQSLEEVKIQRRIFQGDALSPLLFVIAMMPLNHILRKYTTRYELTKSQEKINHPMYTDNIKQFAKNKNKNWKP